MKNKKLVFAVLALVVVVAVLLGVYLATRPEATQGSKTITVTVIHSDGNEKVFTYHTDAEFLGEVILSEGLVVGEDGPYGLYIKEVDGESAVYEVDGAYWSLLIGTEYAMTGADTTPIADGDAFTLVYTIG